MVSLQTLIKDCDNYLIFAEIVILENFLPNRISRGKIFIVSAVEKQLGCSFKVQYHNSAKTAITCQQEEGI